MKKLLTFLLIVSISAAVLTATACNNKEDSNRSSYDIFVTYDDEKQTLTGTVDFTFRNNTDNELADLKFNTYGNAFRKDAKFKPVSETYEKRAY